MIERLAGMSQMSDKSVVKSIFGRILLGMLGSCIGIGGAIVAVGLYIVETLTRPKRLETLYDLYTFTPFELNLPAEEVTFDPLYGKHKVSAWYVPYAGATTTIILCPGYREKRADMLGLCAHLWRAGHNVLVFEYYGHGAIVGEPVTLGYREINDFLGAVVYARQRAPHTRIGAVGYSMGAAVTIMGAARTKEVEAVVADSAFATHKSVIDYAVRRTIHLPFVFFDQVTDRLLWLRAGYRFSQVEPLRDIKHLAPRPVLIIHGEKDTIVDPRDAPLLYEAAGKPKELWTLPGVDHCGAYFADRVAYVKKVTAFFDHYLREDQSEQSQLPDAIVQHPDDQELSEAS
jgi:fermentation-respiration switch protein FrsA (DUF1100 family)